MSWIKVISYKESKGKLRKLYDQVTGPNQNVDNIMKVHSLRPHSMVGHMSLYKNVLHHSSNTLPKWYLETLGVFVSTLNNCDYCIEHHFEGLKRLLADEVKSNQIKYALENQKFEKVFNLKEISGLSYAKRLTLTAEAINELDVDLMKTSGFTDGEILEINQVVSYFNYANRTVLGLGVNTQGDILGLSPNDSEDETNWNHQ